MLRKTYLTRYKGSLLEGGLRTSPIPPPLRRPWFKIERKHIASVSQDLNRYKDRQIDTKIDRQIQRQIDRYKDRQIDTKIDRYKDRQIDRYKDR